MSDTKRIGAVSYLNTRPLVRGLVRDAAAGRVELSFDVPARLADRMAAGELDLALLPSVELARISELEIVPGLGIVTRGPARSVSLLTRKPPDSLRRVALDPHSRSSNALVRVLLADLWGAAPEFVTGPEDLAEALAVADGALRIGDKALFEEPPPGGVAHDLGAFWTEHTGLPFVFAVWAARPGVVDRELYVRLHDSRRAGTRELDRIAAEYRWHGEPRTGVARSYLRENILYRLGAAEVRGLETFLAACERHGLIDRAPELRFALARRTTCHERAEALDRGSQEVAR